MCQTALNILRDTPQSFGTKKLIYIDQGVRPLGGVRANKLPMVLQKTVQNPDSLDQSYSVVLSKAK